MEDILRQARTILRAAWKHRRLGMLFAWLIGAIAAGVILRIPDKYEASARIFVDTQSILKPLMSGLAVQPNIDQQVMMLSRTLISRPNVEKLIRMSDADLNIKSKADQEELIDRLTKTLEIKSTNRDNLYTLSYRDTDPAKAQRIVQSLVSIFVESSLGGKRQDSDSARKFIEEQIRNYEKKLEEAENRLKDFKLRNIEMQTADGKSSMDRLGEIATLLEKSRLELREAENSTGCAAPADCRRRTRASAGSAGCRRQYLAAGDRWPDRCTEAQSRCPAAEIHRQASGCNRNATPDQGS